MRNGGAANSIVRRILEETPENPKADHYILAAEALLDIHKDNRQEKAVGLAMDRMQALIRKGELPVVLLRAGEAMGWLGYAAGLKEGQKWLKKYNVTVPGLWRKRRFNCPTSPVVGKNPGGGP